MATWLEQQWEPSFGAPGGRNRAGGPYLAYRPDELSDRPIAVPSALGRRADEVERAIAELAAGVERGVRERPRSDSGVARLLEVLPGTPVMTTRTVQRLLAVSFPPARAALEELADSGVVTRKSLDGRTTGYVANDVFELLTVAERRLASTRWDTRQSPPVRPVPDLPQEPRRS